MKIIMQEQLSYGRWFSYSSGSNQRICFIRESQRHTSNGRRQGLVDSEGRVLDIIFQGKTNIAFFIF